MRSHRHLVHAVRQEALDRRQLRVAVVVIAALVLLSVAVFSKQRLAAGGYEIKGVFASANRLKPGSDVRIAGVRVGEVASIEPGADNTSVVTLRIDDSGRPIHSDATLAIKPRLLLEGNFYVRVSPGTPGAPELRSGAIVPRSRTSVPVQLDQVLDVFDLATRGALHRSIAGLAGALGKGTFPARDAHDNRRGYNGLRRAVRALDGALGSVAQVAHSARGERPGDLGGAVQYTSQVTEQLARDPVALADLVTSFNRFTRALATEDRALSASLGGVDGVVRAAPPSLRALDAALPIVTDFGGALRPAMRAAPDPLRKMNGLLAQLRGIVGRRELPALLGELEPVTARLPELEGRLRELLPLVTPINRCLSARVVPTLNTKIQDGPNTTNDPVWLDMLHAVTGTTGLVPGFDGNGVALRLGIAEGPSTIRGVIPGIGQIAGIGPDILGVRPTWLGSGVEPPYRPDEWCTKQPQPDLHKRSGPAPTWMTSARR
jgi:phospholipid/cholesterol/gamma-HCH transport system substrate-binding protein